MIHYYHMNNNDIKCLSFLKRTKRTAYLTFFPNQIPRELSIIKIWDYRRFKLPSSLRYQMVLVCILNQYKCFALMRTTFISLPSSSVILFTTSLNVLPSGLISSILSPTENLFFCSNLYRPSLSPSMVPK